MESGCGGAGEDGAGERGIGEIKGIMGRKSSNREHQQERSRRSGGGGGSAEAENTCNCETKRMLWPYWQDWGLIRRSGRSRGSARCWEEDRLLLCCPDGVHREEYMCSSSSF